MRPGGGFVPNFPVFGKVEVNGLNEEPLFTYLKVVLFLLQRMLMYKINLCVFLFTEYIFLLLQELLPFVNPVIGDMKKLYWSPINVNDIRWNFEKFLITAEGMPFKR